MKILFTGGGSGGHFYPIIAVAQEIRSIVKERKLLDPRLYYIAPTPYDKHLLFELGIIFKKSPAGKLRRYFSLLNVIDVLKTFLGILKTIPQLFAIYPDVVFSKGGYASFPTVFAARILRIPVIIHESDAVPGKSNLWAGKFAQKIAVAYPEAASYFPKEKVAYTGNPVRRELYTVIRKGSYEFFKLEKGIPTILILGGSQGSQLINDSILDALPKLVEKFQIIHQTGKKNLKEMTTTANVILEKNPYIGRYKAFDYFNNLQMRMAAGAADLVISRAGAGAISEIAIWGLPSIVIPIEKSSADHQQKNAFSYARAGATIVVKEKNLTPNLITSEIIRLMSNEKLRLQMKKKAKEFSRPDAARIIAEAILNIALEHEK